VEKITILLLKKEDRTLVLIVVVEIVDLLDITPPPQIVGIEYYKVIGG